MHRYLENNNTLEGMRLACGEESIQVFSEIFRLGSIKYKITAMGWIGNKIVVDIVPTDREPSSGGGITLYIARRIETQPALVKTRYLDIYYSGEGVDEVFVRHIQSLRLEDCSIDDLIQIIKKDREFGSPKLPLPTSERSDRPENHLDSWGGDQLYANFLAEGEFARGQLDSVNIYQNCVFIQHSDIECVSLKPNIDLRLIFFLVKYPWLSKNRLRYRGIARDDLPDANRFFSTDLREKDIIMGHNKVREVIDYALENVKDKNIFLSNTCTPVVIGEDVESVVKRARKKRKDLLYLTVTPQSMEVVLKDLFARSVRGSPSKKQNVINLVGFESENYLRSLIDVLKRLGIEVNSVVIPDVSASVLDQYIKGGLDIIKPNALWRHLYDQIGCVSSHKYLSIDAPYGFEGTIKWIIEVGKFVGVNIKRSDILRLVGDEVIGRYNKLRAQMKGIGVLFIFRHDETGYLADSAKSWGVPLLNFLTEMGTHIEIFIKAGSLERARSAAESLLNALSGYNRFEIRYFNSFSQMMRLMELSKSNLVFSNHTDDWRVSSASKSAFSLTDFEIGFEGALYTMSRLLHLSSNRFFFRYGRFLKRDLYGRVSRDA